MNKSKSPKSEAPETATLTFPHPSLTHNDLHPFLPSSSKSHNHTTPTITTTLAILLPLPSIRRRIPQMLNPYQPIPFRITAATTSPARVGRAKRHMLIVQITIAIFRLIDPISVPAGEFEPAGTTTHLWCFVSTVGGFWGFLRGWYETVASLDVCCFCWYWLTASKKGRTGLP